MRNDDAVPVNHGVMSATATTGMEAAKGGVSGLWKGALIGLVAPTVLGVAGLGLIGLAAGAIGAIWGGPIMLAYGLGGGALVGAVGGVCFSVAGFLGGAGIGTMLGLAKGTSRGVDRVRDEVGAATMVQAQTEIFKAQQAGAATTIYAPSATSNHFPPQGSPMNQARPTVYRGANDNAYAQEQSGPEFHGKVNAAEQAAAR